jgi:hypothetical protein
LILGGEGGLGGGKGLLDTSLDHDCLIFLKKNLVSGGILIQNDVYVGRWFVLIETFIFSLCFDSCFVILGGLELNFGVCFGWDESYNFVLTCLFIFFYLQS